MNRREFMMFGAASALCAGVGSAYASGEVPPPAVKRNAPARNRNPYKGLDWSRVMRVKTTSHGHCTSQDMLEKYLKRVNPEMAYDSERILELNPEHDAVKVLLSTMTADPVLAKDYAQLLYSQALLMAELPLEDPIAYTELVCRLMK